MAYRPHSLVAFGGSMNINSETEIWECTVRGFAGALNETTNEPLVNGQTYCDEVAPHLSAWFVAAASGIPGFVSLDYLKCNAIGPDGRYSDGGDTNVHDFTGVTGGATQAVPSFCSVAYSWQTSRVRPPAAFGRIYPPNFSYAVTGSEISSSNRSAANLAANSLLDALANQGSGDAGFVPSVVSKVNAQFAHIVATRVGSVYDVQRRRKNQIPEVYTGTPWP